VFGSLIVIARNPGMPHTRAMTLSSNYDGTLGRQLPPVVLSKIQLAPAESDVFARLLICVSSHTVSAGLRVEIHHRRF